MKKLVSRLNKETNVVSNSSNLPTYVTYVEFRQDFTGPSDRPTTPERGCSPIVSPAQQRIGVRWSVSPDWRLIREGQHELGELVFELLEVLYDIQMVGHCIPQFGPLNCK